MPSLTRLSTIGAVALSLFSVARAHGHETAHKKRANAAPIVGAPDGKVVPRLEVRELQADADAWNLFLLAMQDFAQGAHDSSPMSYYNLAGIHGMPYTPWNGVAGWDPNNDSGYCEHANPMFISWHRPYIVAWEQAMLEHAATVVNTFSGDLKDRMQSALGRLRYPYADFALIPPVGQTSAMPTAMTDPTVKVTTPQGDKEIPNPLYSYNNFNPHPAGSLGGFGGGKWDEWSDTLRYPASLTDNPTTSVEQSVIDAINKNSEQIRAQVYRVLTACDQYMEICNDGATSSQSSCNIDLETIHNGIHSYIGGGGHMSYNNWSAFDAAFFMHHANMDRLFAIWQKLHPDSWMPAANSGPGGSYATRPNSQIDANTPLEPFHDANNVPYTTNSIRDVEKFFYTYPELSSGNLMETINSLYGTTSAKPEVITKPSISSSSAAPSSTSSASKSGSSSASSSASKSDSSSASSSASKSDSSSASKSDSSSASKSDSSSGSATSTMPDVSSMISSALGSHTSLLSNPAISSAMSSAMQSGATDVSGMKSGIASMISSAIEAGATDTAGMKSGIGGMISSALNGGAKATSGADGMVSSIMGNIGSMLGGASATGAHGVAGVAPSGVSGLHPTGVSGGLFPTSTGGLSSLNGTSMMNGTSPLHSGGSPTDRTQDFYCHFVAERGGLATTFNVYAFLGEVPSGGSPVDWMSNKNYCGLWSNFASMTQQKMTGHLVSGSVVLTHCLQQKVASGELKSMQETDVTPYLTKNLNWMTATAAGQQVDNAQVPGLTVGSIAQKIMPASNAGSLPTYGKGNLLPDVTHGKAGGYQQGMQYNWWDVCKAN